MGWLRQSLCAVASIGATATLVGIGVGSSVLALNGNSVALGAVIGIVACFMHDPVQMIIDSLKYSSHDRLMAQEQLHMAAEQRENELNDE